MAIKQINLYQSIKDQQSAKSTALSQRAGNYCKPVPDGSRLCRHHLKRDFKMKRVAILQSNYIPWKGYFDIINYVDEFVIFDDVHIHEIWRNRNKIKSSNGTLWFTIPVKTKGKYLQKSRNGSV